jgi:hypothetical protein
LTDSEFFCQIRVENVFPTGKKIIVTLVKGGSKEMLKIGTHKIASMKHSLDDGETFEDLEIYYTLTDAGIFSSATVGFSIYWDDSTNLSFTTTKYKNITYFTVYSSCFLKNVNMNVLADSFLRNIIFNTIYPIGSLFTSFINKSPYDLYKIGTWERITDRFLYCSSGQSEITGGSKKITIENLPEHNHGIKNYYDDFNYNHEFTDTTSSPYNSIPSDTGAAASDKRRTTYTENTGSGADYMPEYITVYAWRRVA